MFKNKRREMVQFDPLISPALSSLHSSFASAVLQMEGAGGLQRCLLPKAKGELEICRYFNVSQGTRVYYMCVCGGDYPFGRFCP